MSDTEVQADLAAWLGQCIDEDEALIERNWEERGLGWGFPDYRTYDGDDLSAADEYIDHFSPKRMRVECDTKRQVIELHQPKTVTATEDGREVTESRCVKCADRYPCQTLRLQTLPFVERDGYREEWKP